MKKIYEIIDCCNDCSFSKILSDGKGFNNLVCRNKLKQGGFVIAEYGWKVAIPDDCPLETYAERDDLIKDFKEMRFRLGLMSDGRSRDIYIEMGNVLKKYLK